MNKLSKKLAAGLVGLSVCAAAFAVPPDGRGDCDPSGPRYEKRMERMEAHRAQRMQRLHDKLNLRADQEDDWKEFVESKPKAGPKRAFKRGEMANLSAPERMEKALERMKERQERMEDRLEDVKEFYSELTPEQKKIFDEEYRPFKQGKPGKRGFGRR